MLRLPKTLRKADKIKHCVQTIKSLDIIHVKDSLVGDAANRGVSGGQKKRASIGLELVAMPSVIFMDEPTSGLDGTASILLAECLSRLCRTGISIVCVIHQPRKAVFNAFTSVLLLGKGGKQVRVASIQPTSHPAPPAPLASLTTFQPLPPLAPRHLLLVPRHSPAPLSSFPHHPSLPPRPMPLHPSRHSVWGMPRSTLATYRALKSTLPSTASRCRWERTQQIL